MGRESPKNEGSKPMEVVRGGEEVNELGKPKK